MLPWLWINRIMSELQNVTVHRRVCSEKTENHPYQQRVTVSSPRTVSARQKCPLTGIASRDISWEAVLNCLMKQSRHTSSGAFSSLVFCSSSLKLGRVSALCCPMQCHWAAHFDKLSHYPHPTLLSRIFSLWPSTGLLQEGSASFPSCELHLAQSISFEWNMS